LCAEGEEEKIMPQTQTDTHRHRIRGQSLNLADFFLKYKHIAWSDKKKKKKFPGKLKSEKTLKRESWVSL
jgi:hypothetical protein